MEKIYALSFIFIVCCISQLSAQNDRRVSGSVTDTAGTAIAHAHVTLIAGKDTLRASAGKDGNFHFTKIAAVRFDVKITAIGYTDLTATYAFTGDEKSKQLDIFRLRTSTQMLKEVVVKGKPNPVRFMQDTVEYNAAAFSVEEGDNVADLMKQFPGMEIDDEYNVKTMGKEMVKLRVNGEDFFTSDVKSFIGKLPAGIVSKIQVIDDFGDEANFTGIKVGEPRKMLNIVTKPGLNHGKFGSADASAGTNDMIGIHGNLNLWKGTRQSSANFNASTLNNGAGNSRSVGLNVSHNGKIGKYMASGFRYSFNNNHSAFSREQIMESINSTGTFINDSKSEGENGSIRQSLNWNMNYNDKKIFLESAVGVDYGQSDNNSMSQSKQSGVFRQDLMNSNASKSSAPNLNGNISLSKKLKNKSSFSARVAFSVSGNNRDQFINTNTRYYNKDTGTPELDSVLNRNLESKSGNQRFSLGLGYNIRLKKLKDTLATRSLNISYNASAMRSENEASTFVYDNLSEKVSFVDSLSTAFRSVSFDQALGISYNHSTKKNWLSLGFNASPAMIVNHDIRLAKRTEINTFNYSPNLNYTRTLTEGKTLSVNYRSSNINPTLHQLQPIRNTQNLQNIIVGNPDLKPSFSHNIDAGFNYAHRKSGRSLRLGINGSAIQRQIVDHVILIPDTLNSMKQITRYENINGNYQLNGNYLLNIPIRENAYSISFSGTWGFSNRAIIFNNQKAFGKGFNFSQGINSVLSFKKIRLNSSINYSITNNNDMGLMGWHSEYQPVGIGQITAPNFFRTKTFRASMNGNMRLKALTVNGKMNYQNTHSDATAEQASREFGNLNIHLSALLTIKKSYFVNIDGAKTNNYGYALANTNPLIINASVGKHFLKNKSLHLSVTGSDLLGQGNNISRNIVGNTIIDSRSRQQTRVFSLNLRYNLSNFGGKDFRVDPDMD